MTVRKRLHWCRISRLHIKISVQILSVMDRHKDSPMDIKHTTRMINL